MKNPPKRVMQLAVGKYLVVSRHHRIACGLGDYLDEVVHTL
jgi:hypothetical protein